MFDVVKFAQETVKSEVCTFSLSMLLWADFHSGRRWSKVSGKSCSLRDLGNESRTLN